MENKGEIILLSYSSHDNLANKFSNFFMIKTAEVRDTIDTDNSFMSETGVRDVDVVIEGQRLTQLEASLERLNFQSCTSRSTRSWFMHIKPYLGLSLST